MEKLFTLLELQHQAQAAVSRDALLHIIANETRKIVNYTQAVFWGVEGLSLKLEKISGNAQIDPQGLYAADLKKNLKTQTDGAVAVLLLTPETHKCHGAVLYFRTPEEGLLGGLWLENDKPYSEAEQRILEELAAIYAQCLALWSLRNSAAFFGSWKKIKHGKAVALGALLLFLFLPVRMSITAPAEIVAKEAQIVTVPFDGMIGEVAVKPGDAVKGGDLLVTMDQQAIQAEMDMAQQEMMVVQSALSRVQRESLAAPDKKMDLMRLQEEIETKRIAYDYAASMKDRSEIKAARGGIAVFSDPHSLRGKPARTGDKVMMIADPADYEVLVRVPADAMVPVDKDSPADFYLSVSPLAGHDIRIESIGYQAAPDADGLLTYKITASIEDDAKDMRIGWKGTAKIKGDWTVLSYAVLRRPILSLRNLTGI